MTDADKIARLEAELESARREWDNEHSTREALDREIARVKRNRDDLRAILLAARALLEIREVPS